MATETTQKHLVPSDALASRDEPATRPRRLAWAEHLRQVFAADVLECRRCGGRMRVLAAIHPPNATRAILDRAPNRKSSPSSPRRAPSGNLQTRAI